MAAVITITGTSTAGKSTFVRRLCSERVGTFEPDLVRKFTTRAARDDDGLEISTVDSIPDSCDLIYEQYGVRYGLDTSELYDRLSRGRSPVVILNDARSLYEMKYRFGRLCSCLFVFRDVPNEAGFRERVASRGQFEEAEMARRLSKSAATYRLFVENIQLFDSIILNVRDLAFLGSQAAVLAARYGR